jgi:hypothetical protein
MPLVPFSFTGLAIPVVRVRDEVLFVVALLLLLLLSSFAVGGFYAVTVETLLCGAGSFFSTACTQFSTHAWIFHCRPVLAVLLLARRFFTKRWC